MKRNHKADAIEALKETFNRPHEVEKIIKFLRKSKKKIKVRF